MKKITFFKYLPVVALITFGCQKGSKSTAESGEAQEAEAVSNADTTAVSTAQSTITWIGSKPTGQHNGTISLDSGYVIWSDAKIAGGKVFVDIPSLKIMDLKEGEEMYGKLYGHLMSPDFFDAENSPKASFEITSVAPFDSSAYAYTNKEEIESEFKPESDTAFTVAEPNIIITGNLTMRGTTRSIVFPAKVTTEGSVAKVDAKFNIDRTEWNLKYGEEAGIVEKTKDQFIYDTVNTGFHLETAKPE